MRNRNYHRNRRNNRRNSAPVTPKIIGAQLIALPDAEPTIEISMEEWRMLNVAATTLAIVSNVLEGERYAEDTIRKILDIPQPPLSPEAQKALDDYSKEAAAKEDS